MESNFARIHRSLDECALLLPHCYFFLNKTSSRFLQADGIYRSPFNSAASTTPAVNSKPATPSKVLSPLKIPSHHQALPRLSKSSQNPQVNPPTYPTPNSTSPAPSPASPIPTSPVPSNTSASDSRRNPTARAGCTTVRSIACGSSSGKAAGSEGCIEVKS